MSLVTPRAPCTWMARSITLWSIVAPWNLMRLISTRASEPESMARAASSVIRRAPWISAADSAIIVWIAPFSASSEPWA